jgi:hypothetical protein
MNEEFVFLIPLIIFRENNSMMQQTSLGDWKKRDANVKKEPELIENLRMNLRETSIIS